MTKFVVQEFELYHYISTIPAASRDTASAASQELEKIVAMRGDAIDRLDLTDSDVIPWSEVEKMYLQYKESGG